GTSDHLIEHLPSSIIKTKADRLTIDVVTPPNPVFVRAFEEDHPIISFVWPEEADVVDHELPDFVGRGLYALSLHSEELDHHSLEGIKRSHDVMGVGKQSWAWLHVPTQFEADRFTSDFDLSFPPAAIIS